MMAKISQIDELASQRDMYYQWWKRCEAEKKKLADQLNARAKT